MARLFLGDKAGEVEMTAAVERLISPVLYKVTHAEYLCEVYPPLDVKGQSDLIVMVQDVGAQALLRTMLEPILAESGTRSKV